MAARLYLDENAYFHRGILFDDVMVPRKSWEDIERFRARPNDVIIASYPRSGTHWLRQIVDIILDNPETPIGEMNFLELRSLDRVEPGYTELQVMSTDKPRVILTHLPFTLFPKSFLETEGVKIIYIMRNFFDVTASAFKLVRKLLPDELQDFPNFVKFISSGKVVYGGWAEHIKMMWERRHDENILVITYEDLKTEFERTASVIGDFLGRPLTPDKLLQLVEGSSIDRMKSKQQNKTPSADLGYLIDKGEINSTRGQYTDEDFAHLKKYVDESLTNTGIHFAKSDSD